MFFYKKTYPWVSRRDQKPGILKYLHVLESLFLFVHIFATKLENTDGNGRMKLGSHGPRNYKEFGF